MAPRARCIAVTVTKDGQFVLPDITVEQMQSRVREKVIEFGMPAFLAGLFTRRIPKLVRWQK